MPGRISKVADDWRFWRLKATISFNVDFECSSEASVGVRTEFAFWFWRCPQNYYHMVPMCSEDLSIYLLGLLWIYESKLASSHHFNPICPINWLRAILSNLTKKKKKMIDFVINAKWNWACPTELCAHLKWVISPAKYRCEWHLLIPLKPLISRNTMHHFWLILSRQTVVPNNILHRHLACFWLLISVAASLIKILYFSNLLTVRARAIWRLPIISD